MRRLPVIAERSIADVKAFRIEAEQRYHRSMVTGEIRPTCTKGCAYCCRHPFLMSVAEGVLLYRWLLEHGLWTSGLRKRVEEARDRVLGLAFDMWLLSDLACPLLQDETCSAYEGRPLRCRILYSVGDPTMCRTNELGVATPLLPNADFLIGFSMRSQKALRQAGLPEGHMMPLPEALLLGEAVSTGKIDLSAADLQHIKDLLHG